MTYPLGSRRADSYVVRAMRWARHLSVYLTIPALSAFAPLIAIPSITSRYGAAGWAAVAVATSVGATGSVVCDLGWGIIGPQAIARDPSNFRSIYTDSLASKATALAFVLPLTVLIALSSTKDFEIMGGVLAAGTLLTVMTPTWLFIGQGRPMRVLLTDTLPRLVVNVLGAILVAVGAPLLVYAGAVSLGAMLSITMGSIVGKLPIVPSREAMRRGPPIIRQQLPIIFGNILSTVFTSAPVAILAQFNPTVVITTYSAVDRPMRMGLTILGGVPARLQSWVGTPDPAESRRRSQHSIVLNAALGLVAMTVFTIAAPTVARFLFSGTIEVTFLLAILGGFLAAEICFSRGLGLALVAAGRANSISLSVTAGAVVGVGLLLVLPQLSGAAGALVAIIGAEAVMIVFQAVQLRTAWGSPA